MGWFCRWRDALRLSWPTVQARLFDDGGLRSILVLVVAVGSSTRSEDMIGLSVAAGAVVLGILSLTLPEPRSSAERAAGFLLQRLSERGTFRSLALVMLGVGQGASAASYAEHAEALILVLLGAVSAAKPAPKKEG
jgi:hypothetical protein